MKSKVYKPGEITSGEVTNWVPISDSVEEAILNHCVGLHDYENLLIVFTDQNDCLYSLRIDSYDQMSRMANLILNGLKEHIKKSI